MRDWILGAGVVLFGVAAIVASSGYLIGNLPSAQAQDFGPVVTGGEMPFVGGSLHCLASSTCALYTVPADRTLILTGLSSRHVSYTLYVNEASTQTEIFRGQSGAGTSYGSSAGNAPSAGFLSAGRGTLPIPAGTTLEVTTTGDGINISWQGYLAAP